METRDAEQLHQVLAVLAPPKRFKLLLLLLSGVDRSVCQLADEVGLSQSCTTRHLQALERTGLVKGTRDGKRVVFRTAPQGAAAAGVLASLAGQNAPAVVHVTPVAADGSRRRVSLAAPKPRPKRVQRGRSATPIAAAEPATPQADPESGNRSAPVSPPPRFRQELEDYLL